MDYQEADRRLHHARWGTPMDSRKLQNNTYLQRMLVGDEIALQLHNTYIARFQQDGSVILDTGGWRTMLTRDRLSWVSGWFVFSGRHKARAESHWWLWPTTHGYPWDQPKESWIPFFDGIHLDQHSPTILSADEELEREMEYRDPGPSLREQTTEYISLLADPDMLPVLANSRESRGVIDAHPRLAAARMLEDSYFGMDVLLKALDLDIALRGELDRSAPQEVFAWLDLMGQGKEPPRFRSIIRRYIYETAKEGAYS